MPNQEREANREHAPLDNAGASVKWVLISFGWQRQRKLYIVECKCGKAGVFELRREADGEKVRIRLLVHHRSGTCEYNIAETVREGDSVKIRCSKCGRPGYVNTTTRHANPKHPYRRLTVRIGHKLGKRMPRCPLLSLRILSIQTPQPPPAHQAETKA